MAHFSKYRSHWQYPEVILASVPSPQDEYVCTLLHVPPAQRSS